MSKNSVLGIQFDYWHFLIPVFVLMIEIPLAYLFPNVIIGHITTLITVLVLIILQFVNEWKEMIDPYLDLKYGSFANFIINSKRDTKFFVIGLFVGLFVGYILLGILSHFLIHNATVIEVISKLPPPSQLPPKGL